MTFSQELPKGVENFLLNVSVENLLRAQDLIPLLSPLESEKHETSVEYDLNRWLENDAKYNVVDDSYRNGFGERLADYYLCDSKEIKMGILSRSEYDAFTLPLDLEWEFSSSSVSFLEYLVSFFKEKVVKS
ncbi:predicted protein [Sclerotinia sclerotiorum 1980 UF-70]|uniref:Uncharacterized protein n=1 Tax=Sclerotinia sclerotiorum (strain ATCC 18683 / 1980 / Ss-1) TaxID=665079 RepID=A7ERV1_SCLS1|nr:predicted protein [Sclerotinia sclerotiorum 1980 UF-70]EDN92193.1 predicted protein [Sclerotinia sclerotiorum 1980 UF-70]